MSNSQECAAYFRSQPGYRRCFVELRKKWETYGRAAGNILLENATAEEQRLLGGIVGRHFSDGTIRFSFGDFEQGLQKTRFAPVNVKELLEHYFGQELSTRQEQKQRREQAKAGFLEALADLFAAQAGEASAALAWVRGMITKKNAGYPLLMREYEKNRETAESLAKNVGKALEMCRLSAEDAENGDSTADMALAVFAAGISGNPHYFDRGTTAGVLFVDAVCGCRGCEVPQDAHQWRELMQGIGIVPDQISSFVHAYGLGLQTEEGAHPAFEAFLRRRESCVITLENLRGVTGVAAVNHTVFAVENEMVFSCLAEQERPLSVTLLCTSGQPRTAAWELMSLIVKSGCRLYYSGDMDPEGMDIADRIWRKFGNAVQIWRMSPEDYARGCSEERMDPARLSKLDRLEHPLLQETAESMRVKGLAAYQENLLRELMEDLRQNPL